MTAVSTRPARDEFEALLAACGEHPPLDMACALIAADEQPRVVPQRVVNRLDAIAEQIHLPDGASQIESVARINQHLFARMGFRGDDADYDNPRNSFLDRVLDRRKGLPILLGVIYIELARRLGVPVDGIGFPGHFLVSPRPLSGDDGDRFYVDPFHGGEVLSRARLIARLEKMGARRTAPFLGPVSARQLLIRIHNNLKRSYLRRDNLRGALRTVDRLLLLSPDSAAERRDRGLLLARLGEAREAAEVLQRYLAENPEADDRRVVAHQLSMILRGEE